MGWLAWHGSSTKHTVPLEDATTSSKKSLVQDGRASTEHVEHTFVLPRRPKEQYAPAALDLPNEKLPFVSAAEVRRRRETRDDQLWIVVDNIVYDCTDFATEHPGGRDVIESFCGEDCSWQFWRFHNRRLMQEFGHPLRVARTKDVRNRFPEVPRFSGAKKLFMAADDD
jgi:cytochrome b involved in lipid metabolism